MNKKVAIIISPNWKDYAKKYLDDCLDSILKQDWAGESKVFLIDNESTEESYLYLKNTLETRLIPSLQYEIIRNIENAGFAKGNNVAMQAAIDQVYDYLVLFNMDTMADSCAVSELVKAAELNEKTGVAQARIMLWPEKDKINSLGNVTHYLGFGYCSGYNETIENYEIKNKDIFYPSGAAFLVKAEVIKKIGLFDEEFWMYAEDQDLGWRMWLAGYKCVLATEAIVYHKYEFSRSISKYYWMDRNRIIVMLKNYHLLTLLIILPALVVMEFGLIFFAIKGGWFKEKLRIYKYFIMPKSWRYIFNSRQSTQKLRKIKDRDLLPLLSSRVSYQEIESSALNIANNIFTIYWNIIKRIIIW